MFNRFFGLFAATNYHSYHPRNSHLNVWVKNDRFTNHLVKQRIYKCQADKAPALLGRMGKLTKTSIAERMVRKNRLVVKLSIRDYDPHNNTVAAEVEGKNAREWAQCDQSISNDRWGCPKDMPDAAYAYFNNYVGVVDVLLAEGYVLNLDEYYPLNENCDEVDCNDPECEFKKK